MAYQPLDATFPVEVCCEIGNRALDLNFPWGPTGTGMTTVKDTKAILGDLLDLHFPGYTRAMVSALQPGGQIAGHVDRRAEGPRFHLPLLTNPGCWVYHDGVWSQLDGGRLYTMDPTKPHGAVNWGLTLRLHLLIDGWRH